MWSTTGYAPSAIKQALERLGGAVKARTGQSDDEYLIEGNPDELLARAGLMMARPQQSAADSRAEIASLRSENAYLRAKLIGRKAENERLCAENERLKNALHEKVVEMIAAKLTTNGKTKPTADDVVMAARGRAFKIERTEPAVFG
jgi:hypothetical protein